MAIDIEPAEIDRRLGLLGPEFITWVCNIEPDALSNRLPTGEPLPEAQERALEELLRLAEKPARGFYDEQLALVNYIGLFVGYDTTEDTSRAIALRRVAGGAVPEVTDADAVVAGVRRLARDIFPATLLHQATPAPNLTAFRPTDNRFETMDFFGRALLVHPGYDELRAAIIADDVLLKLFPSEGPEGQRKGRWTTCWGDVFDKDVNGLPYDILGAAFHMCALADTRDAQAYVDAAVEIVPRLRRLAEGEALNVLAQVGFSGMVVPNGETAALPGGGTLRAAKSIEPQPPLSDDEYPVLELEVEWRVLASPREEPRTVPPNTHRALERAVRSLRVAALTGVPPATAVTLREEWRRARDPVSCQVVQQVSSAGIGVPADLEPDEFRQFADELVRLDGLDLRPLGIAVDRLLSALDRPDPRDGFVDAVVAWEALFSEQPGESTLRVTAAMTRLLVERPEDREEFHKELTDLYNLRSKVLHGSQAMTEEEARPKLDRAVELAVASLRALLHERQDLIPEQNRSTRLILGST